jgi:hypothetical protein
MSKNQNKTKNNKKILKVSFKGAIFIFLTFCFSTGVQAAEITPNTIIKLVNKARIEQGVSILSENSELTKAAQEKANDMLANNYFAHNSPSGITPWHWIEKNNYDYKYAGENLAINFSDPIEQQAAWMNSASHKKNILNPKYSEIGVAVASGKINGHISTIAVQEFASPVGAVISTAMTSEQIEKQSASKVLAVSSIRTNNGEEFIFSKENIFLIFESVGLISIASLLIYEIKNISRKRHLA